eukprot:scaffold369062_cov48-Prasinocladus_malaysianus.AAC.1
MLQEHVACKAKLFRACFTEGCLNRNTAWHLRFCAEHFSPAVCWGLIPTPSAQHKQHAITTLTQHLAGNLARHPQVG